LPTVLFFNSSYFDNLFPDSTTAAVNFTETVLGLKMAINYGAENYLVSAAGATDSLLAHNYTVNNWISDKRSNDDILLVDKDIQRYFASKLNKAPFTEEEQFDNFDGFLENEVGFCINNEDIVHVESTHALLHSGILLSPGLSVFVQSNLDCFVTNIERAKEEDTLRCIASEGMAADHSSYIQQHAGLIIQSSADIWENRAQLFPNIEFCTRIEAQLNGLDKWNVILARLFELENYSQSWRVGAFNPDLVPSKTTGEGEQVRNSSKAKEARTFECPDGRSRLFLWHQRATPGAIRIYFYPIEEEQRIIVGHIGSKLFYPG